MMTVYKTDNRVLHEVEEMDPGVWIMMTNPTMEESQEVAEKYDIDMVDVRAALDEEESSRIELEDGYTLILVDIPAMEIRHESKNYTTILYCMMAVHIKITSTFKGQIKKSMF